MAIYTAEAFKQVAKRVLDKYAFHKNRKGEIQSVTEKATAAADDLLVIEDSADDFSKKSIKVSAIAVTAGSTDGNAVHVNSPGEINGVAGKAAPVSADVLLVEDSEDSWNKKRVSLSDMPVGAHTHPQSEVTGLVASLAGKEDAFTKNTAFNKDFGTTAGTVAEGNHTHAGQGDMDKAVYDTNDDGKVDAADTADDVGTAAPGNSLYWGTDGTGTKGYYPVPAGGVSDHGALTGLADDDHQQYHNDARGDARYSQLGHNHAGVYEPVISPKNTAFNVDFGTGAGQAAEGNHTHTGVYAPVSHTHTIADVTGLQSALDTKLEELGDAGATGESLIRPKVGQTGQVKLLEAGTGITLTDNTDRITIATSGGGAVTLHDTGSNLFPVFTDTYRGSKVLSVETVKTTHKRNGTTSNAVWLYYNDTIDVDSGWVSHIQSTVVAASISFESASTTGNPVSVGVYDLAGTLIGTITFSVTTNGAGRVVSSVVDTNLDIPVGTVVRLRVDTGAGQNVVDPKVNLYTRWRF